MRKNREDMTVSELLRERVGKLFDEVFQFSHTDDDFHFRDYDAFLCDCKQMYDDSDDFAEYLNEIKGESGSEGELSATDRDFINYRAWIEDISYADLITENSIVLELFKTDHYEYCVFHPEMTDEEITSELFDMGDLWFASGHGEYNGNYRKFYEDTMREWYGEDEEEEEEEEEWEEEEEDDEENL